MNERMAALRNMALMLPTLAAADVRASVEDQIIAELSDLAALPMALEILKTEADPVALFVLTEALAKVYLKDVSFGVASYSLNARAIDTAVLTSSDFKAKKLLVDSALQVLADRGPELARLAADSLANLVADGLALLWLELAQADDYVARIEEVFFGRPSLPLAKIGRRE